MSKGKSLGRPSVDADKLEHVRRMKATGASNRAIAKVLELSPSTVAKYLEA